MPKKANGHGSRKMSVCSQHCSQICWGTQVKSILVRRSFDITRLAYLRAELARVRLERITLAREIQTPEIAIDKKLVAKRRYSAADAEMKNVVRELEAFIGAAKQAQAASGTS